MVARQSRQAEASLRLYVAEPAYTLTGALADHRLAVRPDLVRNLAIEIAPLGAPLDAAQLPAGSDQFVKIAAADLAARRGAALVQAGPRQSADVHALCHWINEQLHAPIDFIAPVDPVAAGHSDSLRTLSEELRTRHIDTLMIVGCNPAYDTPGELALDQHIAAVPFSAHVGVYRDETAARCTWHLPLSHVL